MNQTYIQSDAALNAFKKHDKFFQPDTFEEFIGILDKYRSESNLTGGLELAGEVKMLLKNTMSQYFVSAQSIYQWCGVAINCFQSYLQEYQNTTKDEAMKQHRIAVQVLEDGMKKIHSTQHNLHEATLSFDQISEVSLIPRLDADYADYSNESKLHIQRLESDLKESRKGILSIVRDNDKTRRLKSTIQEIIKKLVKFEKLNNVLKDAIKEADLKAKGIKKNFEDELNAIVDVKSRAEIALDITSIAIIDDIFDFEINSLIKIAVQKLIEKCRKYRARHEI